MTRLLVVWHEARYYGAIRTSQRLTHLSLARHPNRVDGRTDRAARRAHEAAMRHARQADHYRAASP